MTLINNIDSFNRSWVRQMWVIELLVYKKSKKEKEGRRKEKLKIVLSITLYVNQIQAKLKQDS